MDVFFIGPSDLSQSLGHPGRSDVPEVREVMDRAFAAIVAAGRVPGSAGNLEAIRGYQRKGVRYLYTHLPTLLAGASREFLSGVRSTT